MTFDPHAPAFAADPRRCWAELRSEGRAVRSEAFGGFWTLSHHQDVVRALNDDATFSSWKGTAEDGTAFTGVLIPDPPGPLRLPMHLDPPDFAPYRRLLNPAFTATVAQRLAPVILDFTDRCIDRVITTGRMDIVDDLANPVPALVTMHVFGLDLRDWRRWADAVHRITYVRPGTDEYTQAFEDYAWAFEELSRVLHEKRSDPQDDFLSSLATAEVNGRPLEHAEALSMAELTLVGGVDPTSAAIASSLRYLAANPGAADVLRSGEDAVAPAVEELLRFFSPVPAMARTVAQDVEIGDVTLHRGDRVLLGFASANADPDAFEYPDDINLGRESNNHLAFGVGIHRCLGRHLAREELRVILPRVLKRLPDLKIDEAGCVLYPDIASVHGYSKMPATFTPGEPLGGDADWFTGSIDG